MGDLRVMSSVWRFWAALVLLASGSASVVSGEDWPQFRGPGSGGVSHAQRALPGQPARDHQLQWQVTLPTGHSSPVIAGERMFLTGVGSYTSPGGDFEIADRRDDRVGGR